MACDSVLITIIKINLIIDNYRNIKEIMYFRTMQKFQERLC